MPTKKTSGGSTAANNDNTPESNADNAARVLYNIVEDEDRTNAEPPGGPATGGAPRNTSTSGSPPRPAPPPAQPSAAAQAASAGKAYGTDLMKTAGRAVVWCAVWAIFGGVLDPDDFN